MTEPQVDYDSAWKEVLERFFAEFTAFFFPRAHAGIDWSKGYEFLDKELQQVVRDAELGRRLADKLVKVWSRDGEEAWVLVHVDTAGRTFLNYSASSIGSWSSRRIWRTVLRNPSDNTRRT
jgi:hypothetical protein